MSIFVVTMMQETETTQPKAKYSKVEREGSESEAVLPSSTTRWDPLEDDTINRLAKCIAMILVAVCVGFHITQHSRNSKLNINSLKENGSLKGAPIHNEENKPKCSTDNGCLEGTQTQDKENKPRYTQLLNELVRDGKIVGDVSNVLDFAVIG